MTSRTPTGVQPRPPQRVLGSTQQVPRPSSGVQRSLSASQIPSFPSSPSIRDSAVPSDTNPDLADVLSARHVSTPRRQASRLRLELSSELLASGPSSAVNSPQTLTPSRPPAISDPMETGSMSPALSRATQHDPDNPPLPMPKRRRPPRAQSVPETTRSTPASAAPSKRDARPKPYTIEVPSAAPKYPRASRAGPNARDPFSKGLLSGYADFFPWTGAHHEDEWSTEAMQKGTWDRGAQHEAGSGRLTIAPALRLKSGPNALSTLFMNIFAQRRHRGQITAPSTFKPPPRVTLTDTKREIWLKDLANPAISLRRLSRTIPHGIRGRTLLDQCLNKDVPAERAVWLAKCVGANEIRAFKRKGANGALVFGGETKWIREWTAFVEQFLEAVVFATGEPDWKAKMTYAIRLATCLYSEQLLDRDHYLEWIVSSLEASAQSRIPIWILVARIYWTDLLQLRKCSRRLVFALLNHLHSIETDPDKDILVHLSGQLSNLLIGLVKDSPKSFICPPAWQHFGDTLAAAISSDDLVAQAALDDIRLRNAKLSVASTASPLEGRQYLVQLLDCTLQGSCSPELSAKCWTTTQDKTEIVRTMMEWATSPHRPGLAKLYIAAELFRSWEKLGINVTTEILDVMGDLAAADRIRKKAMIRLVAELVRSGHFSVPHYVHWLVGRGGLHHADEIDPVDAPCASRLLVELPLHCLADEAKTQRAGLLRRAGKYSVSEERDDILNALQYVDVALGLTDAPADHQDSFRKPSFLRKLLRRVKNSSRAVQTAIGHHVFELVSMRLPEKPGFAMSLPMFCSIRNVMEAVEDFSMLNGILKSCSTSSDPNVLAACVDTVNVHLDVFMALGSAETLFDVFIERLKAINCSQGIIVRSLLAALSTLAPRLPHRDAVAKQLAFELAQNDRSNALDACSPVSDSMAVQAQTGAESEVAEQIDKLLASGNVIDHPTMNRLFRYIAPKLEAGWMKLDDSRRGFASLLSRLRMLDAPHFDKLMGDWISHTRTLKTRPPLSELFPLLAVSGCLPMQTILHTANISPLKTGGADEGEDEEMLIVPLAMLPRSATYLQELLQLLIVKVPSTTSLEPEESYRFRIQQKVAHSDHAKSMLLLIRNALVEYAALQTDETPTPTLSHLDDAAFQQCLLETMRLLIVTDSADVADALSIGTLPIGAMPMARKLATKLLLPEVDSDSNPTFDRILRLANDLTMPFCQLKLTLDLAIGSKGSSGDEGGPPVRLEGFAEAMDHAIESQNITWTSMLPCLSDDITQCLNEEAHIRFLSLIPSCKSDDMPDHTTDMHRMRLADNLLRVMEAIISGQSPSRSPALSPSLVDKLSDLWEIMASRDEDSLCAKQQILEHWLPALLKFITLHSITTTEPFDAATPNITTTTTTTNTTNTTNTTTTTTTTATTPAATTTATTPAAAAAAVVKPQAPSASNHEARARIIVLLCALLLELETLPSEVTGSLTQQILDIATVLVDVLPGDLRVQCARATLFMPGASATTTTSADPRLYYLLSTARPSPLDNLKLAHRDKIPFLPSRPGSDRPLAPFVLRRWEILSEPTPNVGANDTSLSLSLFDAIKI